MLPWALALAVALALYPIFVYNRLTVLRNRVRNAFAQIDVQLKRRHDLVPNLVDAARAYMAHERATLDAVARARSEAALAGVVAAKHPGQAEAMLVLAQTEAALSGALGGLLARLEAYPQLKAGKNVLALQEQLASTESRLGFARQYFNDAVLDYNNQRDQFPANQFARLFGMQPAEMLQPIEAPEERRAPRATG